jgi:hypothetical protein
MSKQVPVVMLVPLTRTCDKAIQITTATEIKVKTENRDKVRKLNEFNADATAAALIAIGVKFPPCVFQTFDKYSEKPLSEISASKA